MATGTMTFTSGGTVYVDGTTWTHHPSTMGDAVWQMWEGNWQFVQPSEVHFSIYQEPKREEVKDMRGLFHIVVVEYKTDKILEDGLVIAKDKETAKIKALAPFADMYDLDDLDAICNELGDVRKKKEVQKVEIVESK